jgi:hypothetical protein
MLMAESNGDREMKDVLSAIDGWLKHGKNVAVATVIEKKRAYAGAFPPAGSMDLRVPLAD